MISLGQDEKRCIAVFLQTTRTSHVESSVQSVPPPVKRPAPSASSSNSSTNQPARGYQREHDHGRSSSISSISSSASAHSYSSADPARQEVHSPAYRQSKAPVTNVRERTAESLDRGRISPAQLSRQLAKKEVCLLKQCAILRTIFGTL